MIRPALLMKEGLMETSFIQLLNFSAIQKITPIVKALVKNIAIGSMITTEELYASEL